jgi:hypothetical protein
MDSRTFGNLDGRDSLAICIIKVMYVSSQYQELVAVSQMIRKSLQNWFMMGWMGRPNVCNITIVWNWLLISTSSFIYYFGWIVGSGSQIFWSLLMVVVFIYKIRCLGLLQWFSQYIWKKISSSSFPCDL